MNNTRLSRRRDVSGDIRDKKVGLRVKPNQQTVQNSGQTCDGVWE